MRTHFFRFRARGKAAAVLAMLVLSLPAVGADASQANPERRPGGRTVLLAADVDAGTTVPALTFARDDRRAFVEAAAATPIVTYIGAIPAQAQAAVQAAINIWMGLVATSVPMRIVVNWKTITGCPTCLAGAGPPSVYSNILPVGDNRLLQNTWYPPALAEAILGYNVNEPDPNEPDIEIDINKDRGNWYFGTDGNVPSGQYDLESVILHEMLHGFGFLGTAYVNSGQGYWGLSPSGGGTRYPDIWDRKVTDSGGTAIIAYTSGSTLLANALQSNALNFNSTVTNRGLSDRLRLFAPNPWIDGSSYSHLDESTYPAGSDNSLATPYLNPAESVHSAGPLALCLLEALGWQTPLDCTPPARTMIQGSTWFDSGASPQSGPAGTAVSAFATGVSTGRSYRLVTGLDGGAAYPCMWDVVPLNTNLRTSNARGLLSKTTGAINRAPGRWNVCFREEGSGATLSIGAPKYFTVTG